MVPFDPGPTFVLMPTVFVLLVAALFADLRLTADAARAARARARSHNDSDADVTVIVGDSCAGPLPSSWSSTASRARSSATTRPAGRPHPSTRATIPAQRPVRHPVRLARRPAPHRPGALHGARLAAVATCRPRCASTSSWPATAHAQAGQPIDLELSTSIAAPKRCRCRPAAKIGCSSTAKRSPGRRSEDVQSGAAVDQEFAARSSRAGGSARRRDPHGCARAGATCSRTTSSSRSRRSRVRSGLCRRRLEQQRQQRRQHRERGEQAEQHGERARQAEQAQAVEARDGQARRSPPSSTATSARWRARSSPARGRCRAAGSAS